MDQKQQVLQGQLLKLLIIPLLGHVVFWRAIKILLKMCSFALQDHSARMFDRRMLTSDGFESVVHKFEDHTAVVLCVQWSPDKASVFGSSAEDVLLNIWDYEKVGKKLESGTRSPSSPPGLVFQHTGLRLTFWGFVQFTGVL